MRELRRAAGNPRCDGALGMVWDWQENVDVWCVGTGECNRIAGGGVG